MLLRALRAVAGFPCSCVVCVLLLGFRALAWFACCCWVSVLLRGLHVVSRSACCRSACMVSVFVRVVLLLELRGLFDLRAIAWIPWLSELQEILCVPSRVSFVSAVP